VQDSLYYHHQSNQASKQAACCKHAAEKINTLQIEEVKLIANIN